MQSMMCLILSLGVPKSPRMHKLLHPMICLIWLVGSPSRLRVAISPPLAQTIRHRNALPSRMREKLRLTTSQIGLSGLALKSMSVWWMPAKLGHDASQICLNSSTLLSVRRMCEKLGHSTSRICLSSSETSLSVRRMLGNLRHCMMRLC